MVARGKCEASTRPPDHLQKQGSPERAKDTRSSTISFGPSGLKLYPTQGLRFAWPLTTLSPRLRCLSSDFCGKAAGDCLIAVWIFYSRDLTYEIVFVLVLPRTVRQDPSPTSP